VGTALLRSGEIIPHLELAHHPIYKNKTYNDYIGEAAFKKAGKKHWGKRVAHTIEILCTLLHYDHLFVGGGNATKISLRLPENARLASNDTDIEGGARLWLDTMREDGVTDARNTLFTSRVTPGRRRQEAWYCAIQWSAVVRRRYRALDVQVLVDVSRAQPARLINRELTPEI
jgi:hypothetical protein